jgi:prevent-host-death family protein
MSHLTEIEASAVALLAWKERWSQPHLCGDWRKQACLRLLRQAQCCSVTEMGLYLVFIQSEVIPMRYSSQVKPISYLKANAADILLQLAEQRQPLVITQNGEAKAILQDVASYEETQETLALLKILALGNQEIEAGKVSPATDVVERLRAKHAAR